MAGVAEESRRRIARAMCLLGLGLILAGAALIIQHRASLAALATPASAASTHRNVLLAQTIRGVLFWLLVLAGIFGVSTFAFLRWSRRFKKWVLYEPHPPTPAEDVWAMHRLPDEPGPRAGPRRKPSRPQGSG